MNAWEQRKLGELGKTQSGIGFPDAEQGGTKGVPFYKVSDMNNIGNENIMSNANNYVSEEQIFRKKWKPIKSIPAVIFAKVGAAIMLNRKRIVTTPFLIDNNTMAYIFDENWDINFGKTLFETIQLPRYAQVGALPSYNGSDIESIDVTVPEIIEQIKIGHFFKQLDDTITLQERKLKLLKEQKKAYLQKMFPKQGEKIPELRFQGFTDAWEERKLGDIADIIGGGTPSTTIEKYWNGEIDWYSPAEIGNQIFVSSSQRKITQLGLEKSSAKILPIGTILFTSRAGIGNTAILAKEGATNQGFQSVLPKNDILDSYFIFSRTHELKRYGEVTGAGSTFVEVSGKQMSQMPLFIPSIQEQKKIGHFFKELDKTITLQEQQLETLRKRKKAFLQKMFV